MRNQIRRTLVAAEHGRAFARCCLWSAVPALMWGGGPATAQEAVIEPTRMVVPASVTIGEVVPRRVEVTIDFATILRIPGDVSAIVLGNADIADATIVAGGAIALTGKALGTTNVMIIEPDGSMIVEIEVHVGGQKPGTVTVRRAMTSSSYSCTASSCQYNGNGPESVASAE